MYSGLRIAPATAQNTVNEGSVMDPKYRVTPETHRSNLNDLYEQVAGIKYSNDPYQRLQCDALITLAQVINDGLDLMNQRLRAIDDHLAQRP